MRNNMKKKQTKTMKLIKLKRSIMPPPTKVFEDKVKKSSKNYCRKSKSQQEIPPFLTKNKSIRKTKILETQSQITS